MSGSFQGETRLVWAELAHEPTAGISTTPPLNPFDVLIPGFLCLLRSLVQFKMGRGKYLVPVRLARARACIHLPLRPLTSSPSTRSHSQPA